MKVSSVHVKLVPNHSAGLIDNFVFDEGLFGVSDLHVITREGFLTVNYMSKDGVRLGKTWAAHNIHMVSTAI